MKIEYICFCCGYKTSRACTIAAHMKKHHNIDPKTYYDTCIKKPGEGFCLNCGKPTKFKFIRIGYNKYCSFRCEGKFLVSTEEGKEKIRQGMKNSEKWQNIVKSEDYRKHRSEGMKNSYHCTVVRKTKEYRENMRNSCLNSEKNKQLWKNPIWKKHVYEAMIKSIQTGKMRGLYEYDGIKFQSKPELAFYIWLKTIT